MLSGIDYAVVALYLLGVLLLGLSFRKSVHTSEDFFLGGRRLPFWAIGMSLVVSDISAIDFVGTAGQAYRYGVVVANFDWIGCVPAMILAAFVFIPYYRRAGVYTVPEYLGKRFSDPVRVVASLTWIIFLAFNLGVIFWASAVLLNTLMGWSVWTSIMGTAAIVGVYTIFGGLAAVVVTDVLQLILMYVGGACLMWVGLDSVGGWQALMDRIHDMGPDYQNHFRIVLPTTTETPYPWTGVLFGLTFVLANAYWIGNQTIVQRCLAAKNEWHAKASMLWGAFLKMFIPLFIIFPGLIALVLHPNLDDGDRAIPTLIQELLPPGLTGLIFAAFLAGMMSSVDSMVNSTATLWTKDIYEKFIRQDAPDAHYLLVGRLATVVVLGLGILTAPVTARFPGMYVAVQTYLSFFQGPVLSVLLLGILWSRTTAAGALTGLLGGIAGSAILFVSRGELFTIRDPFLYISWWSFVLGFVLCVSVSLMTEPKPRPTLVGLVYGLGRSSGVDHV